MSEETAGGDRLLEKMTGFMAPCVFAAAAELDVFTLLASEPLTADQVAEKLCTDARATPMLLDALVALELLEKNGRHYAVPAESIPWLSARSPTSILPMVFHRMNILRGWVQLAWITKAGIPGPKVASIRGPAADREAFVAAMHTVSVSVADDLIARLGPLEFTHLLDVGGASGTWTMAFLRTMPTARATLFDLPDAVKQAQERLAGGEFADRVELAAGDFYRDELPRGADLAWVSAIVHQHDRTANRELFAKVYRALVPGGRIAIRDVVMAPCGTKPVDGALFAINMLVNTPSGTTFTLDELAEDLQSAGFEQAALAVESEGMHSVVVAGKPG